MRCIVYHQFRKELHIIKTKFCISSLRKVFNTRQSVMIYSPNGLMRYNDSVAIVDDMPLLSQRIKKFQVLRLGIFWRRHPDLNWGIKVLQTSALPLGYGAILS